MSKKVENRRLKRKLLRETRDHEFDEEISQMAQTAEDVEQFQENVDCNSVVVEKTKQASLTSFVHPLFSPSAPPECSASLEETLSQEKDVCKAPSVSIPGSLYSFQEDSDIDIQKDCLDHYSYSFSDNDTCDSESTALKVHDVTIECSGSSDPVCDISNDLVEWAFNHKITHAALNDLLVTLRHHGHTSLPKLAVTLLKTPHSTSSQVKVMGSGEYWYHGLLNCFKAHFKPWMSINNEIVIDFFVDGISPYNMPSKRVSLWPIAGRIICKGIETKPFIIALWCGSSKEPESVDDFFEQFVNECCVLNEGFDLDGLTYKLVIRNGIADGPARAWCRKVNPHNSKVCCERCEIRCFCVLNRMVFAVVCRCKPDHAAVTECICRIGVARTDESFKNRSDPSYHKGTSPLEKIMDMVSQFPLEPLHLVDLGATKRILKMLVEAKASKVSLKPSLRCKIDELIAILPPFMPSEFGQWKPKSLKFWSSLKGKELKRFLKYDGILIMWLLDQMCTDQQKGLYDCFLHLSLGIRILSDPNLCSRYANDANYLLNEFVKKSIDVFGPHFNVYNIHHLSHLADECKLHGHLGQFDSYIYESSLGQMETLLKAPGRPLPQIIARTLERENHGFTEADVPLNMPAQLSQPYYKSHTIEGLEGKCYGCFKKNFTIKVGSCNNNCCLTNSRDVIIVEKVVESDGKIYFVGRSFQEKFPFFESPLNSTVLDIFKVRRLGAVGHWPLSEISKKCVLLPIDLDEAALCRRYDTGCLAIPFTHYQEI